MNVNRIYKVMNQTKRSPQKNTALKKKSTKRTCNSQEELRITTPTSAKKTPTGGQQASPRMRPVTSMCPVDPPLDLRGVPDTCRGACCSQGTKTEGCRGEGEQQEAWAEASRPKMRGSARLSHKPRLITMGPALAHCSRLLIEGD